MKKISRKSFLKLASAAAMSGITAGALAACNAASGSTAASSAAAKYTPGTYTATAKGMSDITMTAPSARQPLLTSSWICPVRPTPLVRPQRMT